MMLIRTWTWTCGPLIIIILLLAAPTIYAHEKPHSNICKPPYKEIYIYTFPVQKQCMILSHSNAYQEQQINKANMEYNAGVDAGQKASEAINFTSWKCPSHDKNFCDGWKNSACSSEGCGGDYICDYWNDTKGCPHNH